MGGHVKSHEEYTIGWICALPRELEIALSMLDEVHPALSNSANDYNCYTLGCIGHHNVSMACLPMDWVGTNQATKVATQMATTFPSIRFILMVGIGAGIPSHVSCGDVVISTEWTQWDFGKTKDGMFEHIGKRCYPPDSLRSVMSKFDAERATLLQQLGKLNDQYPHLASQKNFEDLRVHYGLVASGNQVVKDANLRDSISRDLGKVLCIEMEAAGLIGFPAVIIRGICDYADSNKNDDWHEYAALVAAVCAKHLLKYVSQVTLENERTGKEIYNKVSGERILRHSYSADEERKILDWLTDIDYHSRQNDYFNSREPKTGEWLLNSPEYQAWLLGSSSSNVLFCHGMPGAGKTIITSIVIDHLETCYLGDSNIGIAYIYFNFKRKEEQNIDKLLSSLLKQLVQRQDSIPDCVAQLHRIHSRNRTRPSRREIISNLCSAVSLYSRTFIVIDAIDECQSESDCRSLFLNELFQLGNGNINIFATSRPIFDIETIFRNLNSAILEIRASDSDVRRYLEGKIDASGSIVLKRNRDAIVTKITEVVGGMFLLAQLHFESIKNKRTFALIDRTLKNAVAGPTAYDCAYDDAMKRIKEINDEESQELAFRTISWITCASRPLKTAELQHALAVETDTNTNEGGENQLDEGNILEVEDMISLCTGLVKVDTETDVVRLVHYTTQEYFERTWQQWFPNAHSNIAIACVTYMSYDVFKSGPLFSDDALYLRTQSKCLYQYAVQNWAYHTRKSSTTDGPSVEEAPLMLKFLQDDSLRNSYLEVRYMSEYPYYYRHKSGVLAIHAAAFFGLPRTMMLLLRNESKVDIDAQDSNKQTPLCLAVQNGHEAVVRLLLEANANMEVVDRNRQTSLSWAAKYGYEAIVKLLLGAGAKTETADFNEQTPLSLAATYGHEIVVKLLLAAGASIETADTYKRTPLSWAAMDRRPAVAKLLLAAGANIEVMNFNKDTPLALAAQRGHEEVVRILLAAGANTEVKDVSGRTPLAWAILQGNEEVVELLRVKTNAAFE